MNENQQTSIIKEQSAMEIQSALSTGFNLNALRLPQNFGETLGVRKIITRVPVRKPNKTDFFRVRPGEEWRFQTMILEIKDEGETYVLMPEVWGVIQELLRPAMLHVGIDRRNNVFLIPIPLPGDDGRRNSWHQSLAGIVEQAEDKWVRIAANKGVGGYDVFRADAKLPEPEWPDLTLAELMEIAFRDKIIASAEHSIIRQLLGVS